MVKPTNTKFDFPLKKKLQELTAAGGGGGGGVTDHGALTGLADDDHLLYHTDTRGDTRYYTKSQVDTSLSGKADTSHTHTSGNITDFNSASRAQTETALIAGTNITITPASSGATRTLTIAATGGGSSLAGTGTITVPNNRYEYEETITATGVTATSKIIIGLSNTLDSDENSPDMLDLLTLSATPLTNQLAVMASFSQPTAGPIKITWSAF